MTRKSDGEEEVALVDVDNAAASSLFSPNMWVRRPSRTPRADDGVAKDRYVGIRATLFVSYSSHSHYILSPADILAYYFCTAGILGTLFRTAQTSLEAILLSLLAPGRSADSAKTSKIYLTLRLQTGREQKRSKLRLI
jgi:hypothetical protein